MRPSNEESMVEVPTFFSPDEQAALLAAADQRGVSPEQLIVDLTMERLESRAQAARPKLIPPALYLVKQEEV